MANKFGTPALLLLDTLRCNDSGDWVGRAVYRLVPLTADGQAVLPFIDRSIGIKIPAAGFAAALAAAGAVVVDSTTWLDGEDLPLPADS